MNDKYTLVTSRKEIADLWGTSPQNIGMTYANKRIRYEILDIGTYCINNGITGEMLKQVDGKKLSIMLSLSAEMQKTMCSGVNVPLDVMDKFNSYMEFEKIREKMEKK